MSLPHNPGLPLTVFLHLGTDSDLNPPWQLPYSSLLQQSRRQLIRDPQTPSIRVTRLAGSNLAPQKRAKLKGFQCVNFQSFPPEILDIYSAHINDQQLVLCIVQLIHSHLIYAFVSAKTRVRTYTRTVQLPTVKAHRARILQILIVSIRL
jgi:hypothetical protein